MSPERSREPILSKEAIRSMKSLISDVVPFCGVCGLAIHGHLFKHIASTPVEKHRVEQFRCLMRAVEDVDWKLLLSFQEWNGNLTSADVIGLKCVDGRCSLAVLLCPATLEESYELIVQKSVADCSGPLVDDFIGEI
jgi:hypothetical protein